MLNRYNTYEALNYFLKVQNKINYEFLEVDTVDYHPYSNVNHLTRAQNFPNTAYSTNNVLIYYG